MVRTILKKTLGASWLTRATLRAAPGRLAILCYHDVSTDDDIENWLRVSESRFERQLREFSRFGRFVGPAEIEDPTRLDHDRLNILVTFDDGYVGNLRLALPVLEKLEIPAMFFVSTEHVYTGQFFWSDPLVTAIQLLHLEELDLTEHGLRVYRFRSGAGGRWDDIDRLLRDLKAVGNPDHPTVAAVLTDVDQRYGRRIRPHLQRYRPLNEDELRKLAASPYAFIGSHAHRHEILTHVDDDRLHSSLGESKRILEGVLDQPMDHVAYPNGDADERVVEEARRCGYRWGYVTRRGLAAATDDPMQLPRVMVGGYDEPDITRFLINRQLLATVGRA